MLRLTDDADETGRWCAQTATPGIPPEPVQRRPSLSLRLRVSYDPTTRAHVRLLGPCFKTGRVEGRPIRHRPCAGEGPPQSVQGSGRQTRSPSLCQSNIPGGRGGPETDGGSSVPEADRDRRGYTSARREARAYHPHRLLTAREPVVALCPRKVHAADHASRTGRVNNDLLPGGRALAFRAEFRGPTFLRIHPFTSRRFHVLLNSLFKVLFNFPSRYLSAIGLVPVFSLRWSLPPALGCIPKQPDSGDARSRRPSGQ